MAQLKKPTNGLVDFINGFFDLLLKGVGERALFVYVTAQMPFLGLPVVSYFVRAAIARLASVLDAGLKNNVDIVVIRYQNDARRAAYDAALAPIKQGEFDDKQLQKAKEAIDKLVRVRY